MLCFTVINYIDSIDSILFRESLPISIKKQLVEYVCRMLTMTDMLTKATKLRAMWSIKTISRRKTLQII